MKKLLFMLCALVSVSVISCMNASNTNEESENNVDNDSIVLMDSLNYYLQRIDSINNSGEMSHLHVYELGRLKSMYFRVYQLESKKDTMEYIIFRKDCGGQYYYDWVDTPLLLQEVKYFIDAIDTVAFHYDRKVEHEERYFYITKGDIRLFSSNETPGSNKWNVSLSVDYRKSNSSISMDKNELDELKSMLKKGEDLIINLKN